jgi:hypothetical protein
MRCNLLRESGNEGERIGDKELQGVRAVFWRIGRMQIDFESTLGPVDPCLWVDVAPNGQERLR